MADVTAAYLPPFTLRGDEKSAWLLNNWNQLQDVQRHQAAAVMEINRLRAENAALREAGDELALWADNYAEPHSEGDRLATEWRALNAPYQPEED